MASCLPVELRPRDAEGAGVRLSFGSGRQVTARVLKDATGENDNLVVHRVEIGVPAGLIEHLSKGIGDSLYLVLRELEVIIVHDAG